MADAEVIHIHEMVGAAEAGAFKAPRRDGSANNSISKMRIFRRALKVAARERDRGSRK